MSWKLQGAIAERVCGSITRKMILLNMAARANDDGSGVYAALPTIAGWCEIDARSVRRVCRDLEADGIISVVTQKKIKNGWVNDWQINISAIEALPLVKDELQKAREAKEVRRSTPDTKSPRTLCPPQDVETPDTVSARTESPPTPDTVSAKSILETTSSSDTTYPQKKVVSLDSEFQEVWLSWPRRDRSSKPKTRTLWRAAVKSHGADTARAAIRAYLASPDATKEGAAFVPAMERWLRDKLDAWIEIGATQAVATDDAEATYAQLMSRLRGGAANA